MFKPSCIIVQLLGIINALISLWCPSPRGYQSASMSGVIYQKVHIQWMICSFLFPREGGGVHLVILRVFLSFINLIYCGWRDYGRIFCGHICVNDWVNVWILWMDHMWQPRVHNVKKRDQWKSGQYQTYASNSNASNNLIHFETNSDKITHTIIHTCKLRLLSYIDVLCLVLFDCSSPARRIERFFSVSVL